MNFWSCSLLVFEKGAKSIYWKIEMLFSKMSLIVSRKIMSTQRRIKFKDYILAYITMSAK